MRLIMCCQVIPGRNFQEDIKFSVVAAAFWKRIYPEGEAIVATNGADQIPRKYGSSLKVIGFKFDNFPPALGRTVFMNSYVSSPLFDQDTVFAGHDVLFLNPLPAFDAKVITNYRYHPTQPYCSDLLICRDKEYSKHLLQELCDAHGGMPRPILDGPADQLAYALTLGMPEKAQFNGDPFSAPRRPDVWIVPADKYLFTPNDFFPPCYQDYGKLTPNLSYEEMMESKVAVHFKGNRKQDFFKFGQWANEKGLIDINVIYQE